MPLTISTAQARFQLRQAAVVVHGRTSPAQQVIATGCTQSGSTGGNCAISGTSTSVVTFSVIPGTYQGLHIVIWGEASSGPIGVLTTLNGDTSADYSINGSFQNTSGPTSLAQASGTSCQSAGLGSANASSSQIDFPFYADTTFPKNWTWKSYLNTSISSLTNNFQYEAGCAWSSSAAVTSVTFYDCLWTLHSRNQVHHLRVN